MNEQIKIVMNELMLNHYIAMIKAQHFHWNVEGHGFFAMHNMFEEIYNKISDNLDKIAERLRYFEVTVDVFQTPMALQALTQGLNVCYTVSSKEMARVMLNDLERLVMLMDKLANATESQMLQTNAESHISSGVVNDRVTTDMLVGMMEDYQKTIWMLRSFAKNLPI